MQRLFTLADELEVSIDFVRGLDPRHPGTYSDAGRAICVLDGMSTAKTLSAIAHELGHAVYRDVATMFPHIEARQERRADEWAAHFLIDAEEYRLAGEKYGTRTDWIAQEIGVLDRLVIAYERTMHRIGDEIYVSPKMGAGQWAQKYEVA